VGVQTAYYLSSSNSDLSGGADFSRKLVTAVESASTIAVSVAASSTETSYAFTEPGIPGVCGRAGPRPYTVEVNVTVLNANIQISVNLARVNSAGTVQRAWKASAEQSAGSTGVKTFSFTDVDLGEFGYGDRLRVSYIFRNTAGSVQSVTIGTGTASEEVKAKWIVNNLAASLMDLDRGKKVLLQAHVEGLTDPLCTEKPKDQRTKTYALAFDPGPPHYVSLGTNTALTQIPDWTVLMWIKADALPGGSWLVNAWDSGANQGWRLELDGSGNLIAYYTGAGAGGNTLAGATVATGAWTLVAVSVGGNGQTVIRGLINDTEITTEYVAVTRVTRNAWTGGITATMGVEFDGRIGHCAIFNRALTLREMRRLKYITMTAAWGNDDSDGLWDDCVAQYDFQRGSGALLTNTKNPGTHDGTLSGGAGPDWVSDACYSVTYRDVLSIDASFGQSIEPLGTRSSISGFTLRILDTDEWFTTALKNAGGLTSSGSGQGILRKHITLFLGIQGLLESEYQQILTGEIADLSFSAGAYTIRVKDALFATKQRIRLGRTTLQAALNAGVTASMSVKTGVYFFDAEDIEANQSLQIDDEIITWDSDSASTAAIYTLDSLARGGLSTTDANHASGAIVRETWLLSDSSTGGALKLALYLLISGAGLEASSGYDKYAEVAWSDATTRAIRGRGAGMSPADVAIAEIEDLFNGDPALGNVTLSIYVTEDIEDIKDLIEREVLRSVGMFFFTKYDGRLSMARAKAPSASDVVAALSPREMRVTSWELAQDDIVNLIVVEYNWNPAQEWVGQYVATDATSAARYGIRKREYSLKGLSSTTFLDTLKTNIFARFALPYITVEATCSLAELYLDVGDTVRLTNFNLPNVTDTHGLRGFHDQLWQCVGKRVDLRRGQIIFTLADMSRS
jgi:hypothetical protein